MTLPSKLRHLWRDRRGAALVETAILLPTILFIGLGGLELSNYALAHLRISQSASNLADNASRIASHTGGPLPQVREVDINELMQSIMDRNKGMDLNANGRVILSSLERNAEGGQWIHWQRCVGEKSVPSSYGVEGTGAAGTLFPGMGDSDRRVTAPTNAAVMFAEIIYDYKPVAFGSWMGVKQIRYTSSYLVREDRDLTGVFNMAPSAPKADCTT